MKSKAAAILCAFAAAGSFSKTSAQYRTALPGYRYEFPRDHFNHPEFQTEWWYYTGNLQAAGGRRFGFELTFFRHGVERAKEPGGVWDVRDVWPAHLALSDIDGARFFHAERLNRAGPGLAGADLGQARVWNGNWQARWRGPAEQTLAAVSGEYSLALSMRTEKPPVIHGVDGVSAKGDGPGRASHYVSLTRLLASGAVTLGGQRFEVTGQAWMDHEFFTNQLAPGQTGWDWFSLQFDDGSELMLGRLRRKDGAADPHSSGTYVDARGTARHLAAADFSLAPGRAWTSPETGARYPLEWAIRVPQLGLEMALKTALAGQELAGKLPAPWAYWEGAIEVRGLKQGREAKGSGYLEMTGYAGAAPPGG